MTWSDVADELLVDASARRAQRVGTARALHGLPLDWQALDTCPAWLAAPGEEARERLCAAAGAWWLAASLRASIDGKRLARVRDLLGEDGLAQLRASSSALRAEALDEAPRPLLPPAEDTPAHLLACGRALLGWSLAPALRAPVLAHLGWPVDPRHYEAFDTHAAWARQALRLAMLPVPDAPEASGAPAAAEPDVEEL